MEEQTITALEAVLMGITPADLIRHYLIENDAAIVQSLTDEAIEGRDHSINYDPTPMTQDPWWDALPLYFEARTMFRLGEIIYGQSAIPAELRPPVYRGGVPLGDRGYVLPPTERLFLYREHRMPDQVEMFSDIDSPLGNPYVCRADIGSLRGSPHLYRERLQERISMANEFLYLLTRAWNIVTPADRRLFCEAVMKMRHFQRIRARQDGFFGARLSDPEVLFTFLDFEPQPGPNISRPGAKVTDVNSIERKLLWEVHCHYMQCIRVYSGSRYIDNGQVVLRIPDHSTSSVFNVDRFGQTLLRRCDVEPNTMWWSRIPFAMYAPVLTECLRHGTRPGRPVGEKGIILPDPAWWIVSYGFDLLFPGVNGPHDIDNPDFNPWLDRSANSPPGPDHIQTINQNLYQMLQAYDIRTTEDRQRMEAAVKHLRTLWRERAWDNNEPNAHPDLPNLIPDFRFASFENTDST